MYIKDILTDNTSVRPAFFLNDNYQNIYKKTEKIVVALFMLTDMSTDVSNVCNDTRDIGKKTLLKVTELLLQERMLSIQEITSCIALFTQMRSFLQIIAAVRIVRTDLVEVLVHEIDAVVQHIMTLSKRTNDLLVRVEQPLYVSTAPRTQKSSQNISAGTQSSRSPRLFAKEDVSVKEGKGEGDNRRERIVDIIRTKGHVSIKDISDTITSYSEKTIQRELIQLIKDNIIKKEGERRWSKYSIVNP